MAKKTTLYSYNGIELPDIDTVWTDKETYPYALILHSFGDEGVFIATLHLSPIPFYFNSEATIFDSNCVMYMATNSQEVADVYFEHFSWDMGVNCWGEPLKEVYPQVIDMPTWSNHDILNTTDGTVYLSASEPIPVYDSTTTSINIGQVSPSPKGDWSEGTPYKAADIVRNGNSLYVALRSSLDAEPGISDGWSNYWMLVASDGQAGDIGKLVNALASAEKIVNMTVSATSILFSRNPYITKTTNEETGFLNLDFAIPHQGNPPDPVPVTPFFNIDAGSWEVKQITGTGGASYTEESLGVQDFSNLQYNFDEGMTWREFISSAYNVTVGGQFGEVPDTMSSGWYATTGRKFAHIVYFDFDSGEDIPTLCFAKYGDIIEDWWSRPTKIEIYLDGNPVSPSDLIISGAHYVVGQN